MAGLILSTIHMLVHLINDFSKVTQLVSGGPGGFHTPDMLVQSPCF